MKSFIGIDVSKESLDTCLVQSEGKPRHRKFGNTASGYRDLVSWAEKLAPAQECHFCMESTGCYSFGLASYLADKGLTVSVENPRRIKHFAVAANFKTKTDKVDSLVIALYTQALSPREWMLKDPLKRQISAMRTRIKQINRDCLAERQRLEDPHMCAFAKKQVCDHIEYLDKQLKGAQEQVRGLMDQCQEAKVIYKAVTALNGIGPECGLLLATLEVETFDHGKSVSAYFGLDPKLHQSGKFYGQTRISKQGDSVGRATLMSAANAAVKSNAVFKTLYEKLIARGLKRKQAVAAVARRMLVIAWAIARNTLRGLEVTYPGGELRGKNLRVYCSEA